MNLLEQILSAQNGGAVRQVSQQFGLEEGQASSAISALLPALAGTPSLKNSGIQAEYSPELPTGGLCVLLAHFTSAKLC